MHTMHRDGCMHIHCVVFGILDPCDSLVDSDIREFQVDAVADASPRLSVPTLDLLIPSLVFKELHLN